MCMEDVRLGRDLAPAAKIATVGGGAWVQVLGADPRRTRIIFSGDGTNTFALFPESAPSNAVQGFVLTSGDPRMELRVEEWGRLVTAPWFAFAVAGNLALGVMAASLENQ